MNLQVGAGAPLFSRPCTHPSQEVKEDVCGCRGSSGWDAGEGTGWALQGLLFSVAMGLAEAAM